MKIDHMAIWAEDLELLPESYMRYFNMNCNDKYVNPPQILSNPRTTGDGYYECVVADPE